MGKKLCAVLKYAAVTIFISSIEPRILAASVLTTMSTIGCLSFSCAYGSMFERPGNHVLGGSALPEIICGRDLFRPLFGTGALSGRVVAGRLGLEMEDTGPDVLYPHLRPTLFHASDALRLDQALEGSLAYSIWNSLAMLCCTFVSALCRVCKQW